jgi:hypothetical protein
MIHKYNHDPYFKSTVDMLFSIVEQGLLTTDEIRAAAFLAAYQQTMYHPFGKDTLEIPIEDLYKEK